MRQHYGRVQVSMGSEAEARFDRLVQVFLAMDRLKTVERQNPLVAADRRENTAEHSWYLALSVVLFQSYAVEAIDIGQAIKLALVHDFPEAFVGDTFVYGDQESSRPARESSAMERFRASARGLPEVDDIVSSWTEYESTASPEGRFVMALDVLLPVLMNHANLEMSSWRLHGISAEAVRARVQSVSGWLPEMADLANELISDAVDRGVLKEQ